MITPEEAKFLLAALEQTNIQGIKTATLFLVIVNKLNKIVKESDDAKSSV